MTTIKLSEAKARLGIFAERAAQGETFTISNHNRPVAVLSAPPREKGGAKPKLGLLAGKATVPKEFDSALPDFEKDYYGS